MTYREILSLYKEGKLSESQRKEIEADIEKQDAISDYLYNEAEIPQIDELMEESPAEDASCDNNEQLTALIRKSIRRAFIKMGTITGAVLLVVILGTIFILPHIVSLFYYDPSAVAGVSTEGGPGTNQMSVDMAVYSELFWPGSMRTSVMVSDEGYGKYDISIPQIASRNGRFITVNGKLERNKLTLYDTNTLKAPSGNVFLMPAGVDSSFSVDRYRSFGEEPTGPFGTQAEAYAEINKLSDEDWYTAYVSLSRVMDYSDFEKWIMDKELAVGNLWCGVYTENEYGALISENMGFEMRPGGMCIDWDREKYPYLSSLSNNNRDQLDIEDTEMMKTHFISMLSYIKDNMRFLDIMRPGHPFNKKLLDLMIEDIQENGLRTYGFVITAQKDTIQELTRDGRVGYIYTEPAY